MVEGACDEKERKLWRARAEKEAPPLSLMKERARLTRTTEPRIPPKTQ